MLGFAFNMLPVRSFLEAISDLEGSSSLILQIPESLRLFGALFRVFLFFFKGNFVFGEEATIYLI